MEVTNNLFFWWSVISTILTIIFLFDSIHQRRKQKAQVKIWMQDATGISQALKRIVVDNNSGFYSTSKDITNAIWAVESCAFSLYQSLYEERVVTEKEYKIRQKKLAERLDKEQNEQNEKLLN